MNLWFIIEVAKTEIYDMYARVPKLFDSSNTVYEVTRLFIIYNNYAVPHNAPCELASPS